MSGEERRFFSGGSLAQALMAASQHYHLPSEELAYRQREKRHGFTHRVRAVVIEIDPAAPRRLGGGGDVPEAPAAATAATSVVPARPAVARETRPAGPARPARRESPREHEVPPRRDGRAAVAEPSEEHLAPAREAAELVARLAGLDLAVAARLTEEGVRVELEGADAGWLAAQGAEAFQAFEDVLRRMLRTPAGEAIPVSLDCRGRREAREGELRSLALAAAQAVRRTGRSVELDPLPPTERRMIHLALAGEADLVTESRGEDWERRLEIRLRDARPGGVDQTR